ncbi:glycine cleavage system aminomethyltransferase GcvT [bacterium]|nr:glycine cleavage system aminomethyltransferase GcvT [bacterium]
MSLSTVLNGLHRELGAKMVDFGGWDMPLHYGSQLEEHHQVRNDCGWFDVSHMTVVDLQGDNVRAFLRYLLANNVDKLKVRGKALYTCMLNANGGVIDDLIVYFLTESWFRLVVNAATREKDLAWINQQAAAFAVQVHERSELAMVAVQGPHARAKAHQLMSADTAAAAAALSKFSACEGDGWFIARTGYTGEDGYEIILAADSAVAFCQRLIAAGVRPAGLGARDTLRLEAGMNLYGQDMDESTLPQEAGLSWTLALQPGERDFIGRAALTSAAGADIKRQLVALVMDEKGVLRHGQAVHTAVGAGEILSGTFAPSVGKGIAFARVPSGSLGAVSVDIRGKLVPVRVVKAPFVREGQVQPGIA